MLHFKMDMPLYYMSFYGSAMIVMVLLLRCILKSRLPKYVFPAAWGLVLLRLLVPFSLSSPLSLPVPGLPGFSNAAYCFSEETALAEDTAVFHSLPIIQEEGDVVESVAQQWETATGTAAAISTAMDWMRPLILPVIHIGGGLAILAVLAFRKYRCHRRLSDGLLVEHNETVNSLLRAMDMGHVLVFTSDEIASPLVCGFFNPRIYLPTSMDFENTELLRHIFLHETMHIRHRDNWIKLAMLAALVLNWYNPLVWIMSGCLSADLEAFCDAGVLKASDTEERKKYASSLLAMAVSGSRSSLLYSAFSRTEVEKRIKNILRYKKTTLFALLLSVLLLAWGTVVCATGGQAPFSPDLSAFCASDNSRWGAKAELARDISLGENARMRADRVVLRVLAEGSSDPDIIEERIKAALAEEFHVEPRAFRILLQLTLSDEELSSSYGAWGITKSANGSYLYQGEPVRSFTDPLQGVNQWNAEGRTDISVVRDKYGEITDLNVWHP